MKSSLLLAMSFVLLVGCVKYRIEHVDAKKFMKRKHSLPRDLRHDDDSYPGPLHRYDVYVYDSEGNTYVGSKNLIKDTLLTTKLKKHKSLELPDTIVLMHQRPFTKALHIHLKDSVQIEAGEVEIAPSDIQEMDYYEEIELTRGEKAGRWGGTLVLAIIAGFAFAALLVWLAITGIEEMLGINCYVATMAYGDIHAPEVQLLRKYRDEKLRHHWLGIWFMRFYYRTSPLFVFLAKDMGWLNRLIRKGLDRYVNYLKEKHNW